MMGVGFKAKKLPALYSPGASVGPSLDRRQLRMSCTGQEQPFQKPEAGNKLDPQRPFPGWRSYAVFGL